MSPFPKVDSFGLHPSKSYEFDECFTENYFLEYAHKLIYQSGRIYLNKVIKKKDSLYLNLELFNQHHLLC